MKKLQKIFAGALALTLLLSFSACGKKDDITKTSKDESTSSEAVTESTTEPTIESTTESTTESATESTTAAKKETTTKAKPSQTQKPTTTQSNANNTTQKPSENAAIVGKWSGNYEIPAEYIYDGFLTVGPHTPLKIRETYVFNADGTCSTNATILNSSEFGNALKRDLIDGFEVRTGTPITEQDITDINNYVDECMDELERELETSDTATYTVSGNKINYTMNGVSFYETFTLSGNTLTLTGCSIPDANSGYPVTLYKV